MDIRHLQYFLEVARQHSFTKAAQVLFITQPTISKTVKSLEDELGVTLLDRYGKNVKLTDAGEVFARQAQEIVTSFHNLSSELDDLMNLKKGHIRIGLPPMIGASFFPKVIGAFYKQYPNITIQLFEDGGKKVENDILSGALDVGVTVLPADEDLFDSYIFVDESLKVVLHPTHPLAEQDEIQLAELSEDGFILFREDFSLHDRIIGACQKAGYQPRIIYESAQWDLISNMVAAGLGVALLPETICRELRQEEVRILKLKERIPWDLGMVWRKDRYQSFAVREWIAFSEKMLKPKD
ncbi:LysR family transcriptional regulator [Paenibacillus urinalis]|uniref:LysR family transcriptional regulator n=1 Tax=Paenibacillus urinalis TaxID=521520 RepID=A0AAX3MXT5_9BACL|nr:MULTISPECIES: LysR family transcriptional regulator [Paenibacillus]WDH82450.1 LysR family transcriptional regulator [Paenibacillus urinalis]WDH98507.1 LysR family transcriptional regulator [Paenibacillus urinalis]WDI02198.1 LysR family transcriptional regulator [Paenibacillus urinalis]GAK40123.1 transcriptional regulator [Paenibacillus sp. TCA20]